MKGWNLREDIALLAGKMNKLSRLLRAQKLQDPSMQDDIYRIPFENHTQRTNNKFKNSKWWKLTKLIGLILLALILGLLSAK